MPMRYIENRVDSGSQGARNTRLGGKYLIADSESAAVYKLSYSESVGRRSRAFCIYYVSYIYVWRSGVFSRAHCILKSLRQKDAGEKAQGKVITPPRFLFPCYRATATRASPFNAKQIARRHLDRESLSLDKIVLPADWKRNTHKKTAGERRLMPPPLL